MTVQRLEDHRLDGQPAEAPLLNRELSWLEFNERVLALAAEAGHPAARAGEVLRDLLEQPRRVLPGAGRRAEGSGRRRSDRTVARRAQPGPAAGRDRPMPSTRWCCARRACCSTCCCPSCKRTASRCSTGSSSSWPIGTSLAEVFERRIFPVLTPLAVDPAHPFPYISNLALSLAAMVSDPDTGERRFARVKVPTVFPRLIALPDGDRFVPVEQVIAAQLHTLFSGMVVEECAVFRVTRNADLTLEDEEADDLLAAVELELRRRRFGRAVRLEAQAGMSAEMLELLVRELDLEAGRRLVPRDAARPDLPVAAARTRPARPEGHAVAAGHRRSDRRRRRGRAQHLLGHPRAPAAGAPPVRELRQQHRELHRPGRRRPQGAVASR